MTYTKTFRTELIAEVNIDALEERYRAFLKSLDDVGTEIISVNYQVAVYRLDEPTMDAGISFSVLVTYSVRGWVDDGSDSEPTDKGADANYMFREVKNE
jgi:hypothetical protein